MYVHECVCISMYVICLYFCGWIYGNIWSCMHMCMCAFIYIWWMNMNPWRIFLLFCDILGFGRLKQNRIVLRILWYQISFLLCFLFSFLPIYLLIFFRPYWFPSFVSCFLYSLFPLLFPPPFFLGFACFLLWLENNRIWKRILSHVGKNIIPEIGIPQENVQIAIKFMGS